MHSMMTTGNNTVLQFLLTYSWHATLASRVQHSMYIHYKILTMVNLVGFFFYHPLLYGIDNCIPYAVQHVPMTYLLYDRKSGLFYPLYFLPPLQQPLTCSLCMGFGFAFICSFIYQIFALFIFLWIAFLLFECPNHYSQHPLLKMRSKARSSVILGVTQFFWVSPLYAEGIYVFKLSCIFLLLICLSSIEFLDQPEEPRTEKRVNFFSTPQ